MKDIKAFLTPEQWAAVLDDRLDFDDGSWVGVRLPTASREGYAAAALLGHFTWEDVDALREWADTEEEQEQVMDPGRTGVDIDLARSLADRIAALLPPREP